MSIDVNWCYSSLIVVLWHVIMMMYVYYYKELTRLQKHISS